MNQYRSLLAATGLGVLAGLGLAGGDVGSTFSYLQTIPRSFAGLPRPTNLDWIEHWSGAARALAAMPALLDLITSAALLGLAVIVWCAWNPGFRLTAPVPDDAEPGAVLRQPIDRGRLRQLGAATVVTLWLLGVPGGWVPVERWRPAGLLLAGPMGMERLWPGAAAGLAGLALLLGGLWLVWGEAGFLRPAAGEPRRGEGIGRALGIAALAGIALTPLIVPLTAWAQQMATEVLQGMGGAARSAWIVYLDGVLVVYPLALGAAGWMAISLARWARFPRERRALAVGVAAAAVAWLGVGALLRMAGSGRFDDGVPLAQAAGVPSSGRSVLITLTLMPGSVPVVGLTPAVSGQGLAATDASARAVWAYLRWRRFRTVNLFPALMHVCQCEALAWNSDRFLETTLLSLSYNPHPGFCELLEEKLWHCGATPAARGALARLQDPRWFRLPPGGQKGLALLRRRLAAGRGAVRGRLLLNGAPAVGMQVGLLDAALWQQFRGTPRALNHRLVATSARVGAAGAFRLEAIPAGRYFLLVRLPAGESPLLPGALRVQGSPGLITVAPSARRVELGSVRLVVLAPPIRNSEQSARAGRPWQPYFLPFLAAPGIFMSQPAQQ